MKRLSFTTRLMAMTFCGLALSLKAQEMTFHSTATAPTVVELFSSEGCSSCPPAEALLGRLKDSPQLWKNLFPVEFHVDYWDGLGWPDHFARAEYTQRQRIYAARLHQDSVYTPEFVVNGCEWRGFFEGTPLLVSASASTGSLALTAAGGGKKVSVQFKGGSDTPTVNVALLGMGIVIAVQSGENAGRQLNHDFVALDFVSQPMQRKGQTWDSAPLSLHSHTTNAPSAIVAWISAPDGSILQAAGGPLKSPAVAVVTP